MEKKIKLKMGLEPDVYKRQLSNTANLWMRSTASAITSPSMYHLLIILAR